VAQAFLGYWQRMHDQDPLPLPSPLSAPMNSTHQSAAFRKSNETPSLVSIATGKTGSAQIQTWFAPNRPENRKPTGNKPAPVPLDLQEVYRLMRQAQQAVLFLAFYPGQRGVDCMIGEAIDIGRKDHKLIVVGAVSSPQAMPNYVPGKVDPDTGEDLVEGVSPSTFTEGNVAIVRAARIDEKTLMGDLGIEKLTAKQFGAIIHDKIVVIDPLSSNCSVILGSHNLGFKASYSNDENMVIVSGHRELAMAYAVHVLDVYDHYRFRAIANEQARLGKPQWSGFLDVQDGWQDGYVSGKKGALSRYFSS
jgi:phosphatidylserine/phosphatidylglycerophosphate/cardiolipin synthase-like enzyme